MSFNTELTSFVQYTVETGTSNSCFQSGCNHISGTAIIRAPNVIDHGIYGTLEQTSRPKDMVYSDNMHASGRPVSPGTEAVGPMPVDRQVEVKYNGFVELRAWLNYFGLAYQRCRLRAHATNSALYLSNSMRAN